MKNKSKETKPTLADIMSLLHSDKNSMLLVQEQIEQPHKIEHSETGPGTSTYVNMGLQINEKSCKLFRRWFVGNELNLRRKNRVECPMSTIFRLNSRLIKDLHLKSR